MTLGMNQLDLCCVLCGSILPDTDNGDCCDVPTSHKILPCFHVCCRTCVRTKPPQSPGGILTCPRCNFKVILPKLGLEGLRDFPTRLISCPETGKKNSNTGECFTDEEVDDRSNLLSSLVAGANMSNNIEKGDKFVENGSLVDEVFSVEDQDLDEDNRVLCDSCGFNCTLAKLEYCHVCDEVLCSDCLALAHVGHQKSDLPSFVKNKKQYVQRLLEDMHSKVNRHQNKVYSIGKVTTQLSGLEEELRSEINQRSDQLVQMIERRREYLLGELIDVFDSYTEHYQLEREKLQQEIKLLSHSNQFVQNLTIPDNNEKLFLQFHNDITNNIMHLTHHLKEQSLEILNIKLDIPDRGKEESHLEKLFGALVQGNASCGNADLLMSLSMDLKWPTGIAISKTSKEVVISGKTGTFESQGKLMFYSKHGTHQTTHEFEENCFPNDIKATPDGGFLVTDTLGRVLKFSANGRLVQGHDEAFKGYGQVAAGLNNSFYVTSAEDQCVYKFSRIGASPEKLPASGMLENGEEFFPHGLTSNGNGDLIITDWRNACVDVFDSKMQLRFQYKGEIENPAPEHTKNKCHRLKCPAAVCCDPFDNLLIADFTNDSIHLVTNSGQFLGFLLTKDNGISCPNSLALDHEGHLYVGQYGGDVQIFRYLSYVKHA